MNKLLRRFVADKNARFRGKLGSPDEVFKQQLATDQALDTAVIGGYGVRDILAGKVRESEIPPVVLKAFHLQYPHVGGFVDFVRDHKDDAALLGIINGIKGKAFELEYLDYLNHGHLPASVHAELAHLPTQEGWDIAIRDAHGHVIDKLQLKATNSLPYIRDAIAHHPEFDVVATHEVFQHLHDPEILSRLSDSGISNAHLTDAACDAIHDVVPGFQLIPWVAFAIIGYQSWRRYRAGAPLREVTRTAFRRGTRSTACRGMAYFTALLAHEHFVGTASSVLLSLGYGRYEAENEFVEFMQVCRKRQESNLSILAR
jgi:hypothetical protein